MRYIDVCSGISAPTAAWKPLGWQALCYAEIEAAPRAVLAHHYPDVPLVGDFTQIKGDEYGPVDLLVGGTPCQSFSIAGLRGGLADGRGNLALEYLRLADRARPRWLVWENVPGVLSSNGGRDFGAILGGMGELGYGFAYRVLDAQHFGVPQRRRRVFVVGYLGDWRRAAAVLFERHGLSGHPAPRREAREETAVCPTLRAGGNRTGGDRPPGTDVDTADSLIVHEATHDVAGTMMSYAKSGGDSNRIDNAAGGYMAITHSLRADGFRESHANAGVMPAVAYAIQERAVSENLDAGPQGKGFQADVGYTLEARNKVQAVAFAGSREVAGALTANYGKQPDSSDTGLGPNLAVGSSAVRRLTPRECERLQGFPETVRTVRIEVCEGVKSDHAKSAPLISAASNRALPEHAAVRVLIDFEQQAVRLLRADGSNWYASGAERPSASPLSMPTDAFARLAAHTIISLVPVTEDGSEALRASIMHSTPRLSGNASVSVSGREIAALANDVERFTSEANRLSKFTTSPLGPSTPAYVSTLQTWSCCVLAAISGFIPAEIRSAASYCVEVEVVAGFTSVPYRNRMMADGPRYKMLGNSMAVPVMAFIGQRIAMVDATRPSPAPPLAAISEPVGGGDFVHGAINNDRA